MGAAPYKNLENRSSPYALVPKIWEKLGLKLIAKELKLGEYGEKSGPKIANKMYAIKRKNPIDDFLFEKIPEFINFLIKFESDKVIANHS
ncbi:MAG: hypothetical protein RE472_04645 [Thermoplasmatales archaeon]|nr:hypothetical protein [Cuniculiplasma divulgatum]WMT50263.1 MAG: hypothetical protein RE472_04645 [Thermoplasmatales archaeon]